MQVTVIRNWNGDFRLDFRLRGRNQRVWIEGANFGRWNKSVATRALNELDYRFGINRKAVRFFHFDDGITL